MRAHVVVLALAAALCAPALGTSASAQGVSPRTVLTIHSGRRELPFQSDSGCGHPGVSGVAPRRADRLFRGVPRVRSFP